MPVYDNAGAALPRALYAAVRPELVERFGGLTAYTRAPATGLWREGAAMDRDDIIVYEVMVPDLDRKWWAGYRSTLERRFAQDEVMIRALSTERL